MPGMIPTAFTMLWIVAWFDGRTTWNREGNGYCFTDEKLLFQSSLENDTILLFVLKNLIYVIESQGHAT